MHALSAEHGPDGALFSDTENDEKNNVHRIAPGIALLSLGVPCASKALCNAPVCQLVMIRRFTLPRNVRIFTLFGRQCLHFEFLWR